MPLSYPRTRTVGRGELGSLVDILTDIRSETGVSIWVTRVIYD
ncbi:hypothetical protein CFBP4996_25710 (plasmid) [Agrobacterium leguminum]|uniref:Transposase n=1 Tax=Agrobacterium deltaense NCPPB 1641 TaxID=1183425 RepID=A0A1S7UDA4_9HYPH|nr:MULTISPECIES: hypothetical protein [Agrobacterium]WFS69481.1 hypothetical protein CFBP4996_25710 [Agrobacterium leguminum]CVI64348.1 conserved hypothetical protein [Agrobacterium deltaense NCPPB 1641]